MGIQDPKIPRKRNEKDLSKEVAAFRAVVRQQRYLTNPSSNKPLTSLDGVPLDPNLVTFSSQAREKRAMYYDVYQKYEHIRTGTRTTVPFHEAPVFITPQEREEYQSLSNQTIAQLKEIIQNRLQSISVSDVKEVFTESYKTDVTKKKGVKKQDFLDFVLELNDYLENEQLYLQDIDNIHDIIYNNDSDEDHA